MKKIMIIFFAFLQLSSFSQKTDRDNAKAAFMEIIECYFKKDCNKFYSYFGDSVTFFGSYFITTKKMLVKKDICTKFDSIIQKTKTKENYLEKYDIDVFSYKDFSTATPKFINDYMIDAGDGGSVGSIVLSSVNYNKKIYSENDFLIIGDMPTIKKYENRISSRYILMLRKTAKGWKIVGLTNPLNP